ncbi:MAG: hypothetical protein KKA16_00520 [Alphaproteobacteria bacterium]|nr:hypothetical protein [Alphaproteobacteria bacterium]MBU2379344.1 hypothetical protein [Alphaproteobacteria bacterium]
MTWAIFMMACSDPLSRAVSINGFAVAKFLNETRQGSRVFPVGYARLKSRLPVICWGAPTLFAPRSQGPPAPDGSGDAEGRSLDQAAVVDRELMRSRKSDELPAFRAIIEQVMPFPPKPITDQA